MACIPSVVMRPHRPPSPSQAPVADEKKDKKGGKGKQADAPPPEPEPEPELDENGGKSVHTYLGLIYQMCFLAVVFILAPL